MRYAPLLRIFSEMIASDVDIAHFWSTQTKGPAGLSNREGEGHELSPTGIFFDLLSKSTNGTQLVEDERSPFLINGEGENIGYTYFFEGAERSVYYFVSGSDEDIQLNIDLSSALRSDSFVYLTKLTETEIGSGERYWANVSKEVYNASGLAPSSQSSWNLMETLAPYELLEVHISYGVGAEIRTDTTGAIADLISGGQFSDSIFGYSGNDSLNGGAGDDEISGGAGNDSLAGESGNDTVHGGFGDDYIVGEQGMDVLFGDDGNDNIFGGNWHDTLTGGLGNDSLDGGSGNDLLLPGLGRGVASGGTGQDTLSFEDLNGAIYFDGVGRIILHNADEVIFTEIEVLRGSEHGDRIDLFEDAFDVFGLAGDDEFFATGVRGNVIDSGTGNDNIEVRDSADVSIYAGSGDDIIFSVNTDSSIYTGAGFDIVVLEEDGVDKIYLESEASYNVVMGFNPNVDEIYFGGDGRDLIYSQELDGGTRVVMFDGPEVFLVNIFSFDIDSVNMF